MTFLPLTAARAHVTVHPSEAPAGSFAKLSVRVPHGCDGSPTIRLRVQIPEGATSVKPMVHPLWKIETVKKPLDKPYESHGKMITETVTEVIWSGGSLPDEFMDEFSLSLKLPDRPGETIPILISGGLPPQRSLAGWAKGLNAPESHNLGAVCCSTYFFNCSTVTPPQEATK